MMLLTLQRAVSALTFGLTTILYRTYVHTHVSLVQFIGYPCTSSTHETIRGTVTQKYTCSV